MNSTAPGPSEEVFLFPRRKKIKTKEKVTIAVAILVILSQGLFGWAQLGRHLAHAAPAEGALVRNATVSSVYYVGRDGRRYVFPNEATYFSWYPNFDSVQVVDDATLASMAIGPLIPVRPNIRTVHFDSDPKIYAVEPGGVLRWIPDEATFLRLGYRFDQVVNLPDVFRVAYTDGTSLSRPASSAVVQVGDSGPMYYVRNGTRYPITAAVAQLNRYFTNHIRHVPQEAVDGLVDGSPIIGFDQSVAGRPDDQPGAVIAPQPQNPTSTAPSAPTNFAATGGSQQAQLNWMRSSSGTVLNYVVYLSFAPITNVDVGGVTIAATPPASASNLNVTGLAPSTLYYFAIRAAGAGGVFSPLATTSATTLDINAQVPPNPPTSFAATGGSQQVSLSWVGSATPSVTNYVIYRSLSFFNSLGSGEITVATTTSSSRSYTNTGLASSTGYNYAIRALASNGLYSALVTASAFTDSSGQPPASAPNPPTNFTATPSSQAVQLAWSASNSQGIQSYQVYRSLSSISNPAASGVTAVATVGASTLAYLDSGLSASTAYYYAVRAVNSSGLTSSIATAQATTTQPPLDRILQLPEQPDNVVSAGSLQRSMDLASLAVSLGINKFMVPTTYYQGLNDLSPSYTSGARCTNHNGRFCGPYNQFLSYLDTLHTPDGRPAQAIFLTAKVTKAPLSGDPQDMGAMQLRRMGVEHAAYDLLPSLAAASGTLPPSSGVLERATLNFTFSDPMERDRLLRMVASFSGNNPNVLVRWRPTDLNTAKFMEADSQGSGTHTYDFPNPSLPGANNWQMLIFNYSFTDSVNWSISSFGEVDPAAGSVRGTSATTYDWLGNGYMDLSRQPRYALDSTVTRFVDHMNTVWNEFHSHPSFIGSMGNGDEPAAMYWAPEDTSRYANAGDELASFEKSVANGQFSASGKPLMLFGDPRDPTQNGLGTGSRGVNMAGGGFSDMASRFSGNEPIQWVLWSSNHSTAAISNFTSQGFGVYLMQQLGDPFVSGFQSYVAGASALPSQEKARVKGYYYYTDPGAEGVGQATQSTLQQAINVTPDHL